MTSNNSSANNSNSNQAIYWTFCYANDGNGSVINTRVDEWNMNMNIWYELNSTIMPMLDKFKLAPVLLFKHSIDCDRMPMPGKFISDPFICFHIPLCVCMHLSIDDIGISYIVHICQCCALIMTRFHAKHHQIGLEHTSACIRNTRVHIIQHTKKIFQFMIHHPHIQKINVHILRIWML